MSVAPARRTALKALAKVRVNEAFSGPVLAAELASASLSPADAALATRLTYGVLAASGVLDEVLARHAKGSLEPRVRDALRLATFEMLYGRAPAYAVVDQAVETVRAVRPQAAGLANAVMRRIADTVSDFPWGEPSTDRDAFARATGHPRWIVDLALEDLGPEAGRQMLDCGLEPAPVYARVVPFGDGPGCALEALASAAPEASPPDPDCYRLTVPSAAFRGAMPVTGWFPMDAAAQMAPLACAPRPGEQVLDVGAGRGNKTLCLQAVAERAGGPAEITALDIHSGKVSALRSRLDESHVPGVTVMTGDAEHLVEVFGGAAFDAVLLDAPCSGLGTLRRYPEKRWRLAPEMPTRMAELQSTLLASASRVVKPGGRVVYSTCSVAREENDLVVEAFLSGRDGHRFTVEPLGEIIPSEWGLFRDARGCFRSWPTSGGPDGHYVAVLRRQSDRH